VSIWNIFCSKAAQILAEKLARSKAGKALLEDLKPKEGD